MQDLVPDINVKALQKVDFAGTVSDKLLRHIAEATLEEEGEERRIRQPSLHTFEGLEAKIERNFNNRNDERRYH